MYREREATNINRILDTVKLRITDLYHKHLSEYGYVLPEKIKNVLLGIETDKKKILLEHSGEHNDLYLLKIGRDTSQITHGRYELTNIFTK